VEVAKQVNEPVVLIEVVGTVIFCATLRLFEVVQLLVVLVNVKLKVPPWFTVIVGVPFPETIPLPDHVYVAGDTVEEILTVTNVLVHVMVLVTGLRVTDGAPALGETITVDELIHPLIGFVAVRVYTPAPQTEVVSDVAVPQTFGPVQFTVGLVGDVTLPFKAMEGVAQVNV
jgi:hypothetical protein